MKLIRQVKKGNNVFLYFEDAERIKLSYEIAVKAGLRKGDDVSEEEISSLIFSDTQHRIKNSAFRLLARRSHSEKELRDKLNTKFENRHLVDKIIEELKQRDYLDDYKFAIEFAELKLDKKKFGTNKLKAELIKRGVSRQIIEKVIHECVNEEQQLESAKELARKKINQIKRKEDDPQKIKLKLSNFLASKGFDYSIIKEVISSLLRNKN